jgi:hypothetical protein
MKQCQLMIRTYCFAAVALVTIAILAINTADAQQRQLRQGRTDRQDRRDRDPSRTNVQCVLDGYDATSKNGIEDAVAEAYQYCRSGDTVILKSPTLVARLCDFGWAIAPVGQGTVVCVYGGTREVR